ncbi:leucine-rich repeat protein [Eubacterium sp.]|uniref:leucine-rich repeat domain-containing protein n=1 Tax=Eubacterium sp. TaxID=142586 RepID=UPI003F0C8B40
MNKPVSLLLSISVIFSAMLCCLTANADEATQGSCGENTYWIYDAPSTTLTISGTGEMGEICFGEYEFGNEATKLVVEPGITSISTCAFDSCSALTDVSLPNTLTTICDGAFWGCESLRQIDIPSSVTQIQGGAFQYCTALENITLPDGITEIFPKTFSYCKNLKYIEIPNSVTSIGQYAFNNSGIIEITIPENVTIIDQEAFSFSALETLNIYSKELSVKQYAFKGSCLNEVNTNSIASWCGYSFFNSSSNPIYVSHNLYLNGELITDLVIPEGVTRVESVAFYSCENISTISFPSTLQSIGTSAFRRCKGIKKH